MWTLRRSTAVFSAVAAAATLYGVRRTPVEARCADADQSQDHEFRNWSNTHACTPRIVLAPSSTAEAEYMVAACQAAGQHVRAVGTGLSPNGLAFSAASLMSMAGCNRVLHLDVATRQVTVEAGIRVHQLTEALRPFGLALQTYASIDEQQIGGLIQTGAHGTGLSIPPAEEQVVSLKLATPGLGVVTLSRTDDDPTAFWCAVVALGALGVVTEVTLQCVEMRPLIERTYTRTFAEIQSGHTALLQAHQRVRYLWIAYTDTCVVTTWDELPPGADGSVLVNERSSTAHNNEHALAPLRDLLTTLRLARKEPAEDNTHLHTTMTSLRDAVLALGPIDVDLVIQANQAEAEYWRRSASVRVGTPSELLCFDCGGEQWVWEAALPAGTVAHPDGSDVGHILRVIRTLERQRVAMPSPIEHRWTRASRALLSPAYAPNPDNVFAWLGFISYLPTQDPTARAGISAHFALYCQAVQSLLPTQAKVHWGKLEVALTDPVSVAMHRSRLRRNYGAELDQFLQTRDKFDPKHLCSNDFLDALVF